MTESATMEPTIKPSENKPRKRKKTEYLIMYAAGMETWLVFKGGFDNTEHAERHIRNCDPNDAENKVLFENEVQIVAVKYRGKPETQVKTVVSM